MTLSNKSLHRHEQEVFVIICEDPCNSVAGLLITAGHQQCVASLTLSKTKEVQLRSDSNTQDHHWPGCE